MLSVPHLKLTRETVRFGRLYERVGRGLHRNSHSSEDVKVHDRITKNNELIKYQRDKGRKHILFKPGDLVWLHMRKERFPAKRRSKLSSRSDGPFKILEKVNDNVYKIDLPGNVSTSFNVADLQPYFDPEEPLPSLRTNSSDEGEDDRQAPEYPISALDSDPPESRQNTSQMDIDGPASEETKGEVFIEKTKEIYLTCTSEIVPSMRRVKQRSEYNKKVLSYAFFLASQMNNRFRLLWRHVFKNEDLKKSNYRTLSRVTESKMASRKKALTSFRFRGQLDANLVLERCLCSMSKVAGKGAPVVGYLIQVFFERLASYTHKFMGKLKRWFLAFGWLLEEIHVAWAHLEKKRTRLWTYTKSLNDFCKQWLETASQ
nr:transposon Ty3-I Gag-Pol polyprotein [Tanacetum cinerariifolium]